MYYCIDIVSLQEVPQSLLFHKPANSAKATCRIEYYTPQHDNSPAPVRNHALSASFILQVKDHPSVSSATIENKKIDSYDLDSAQT